MKKFADKLSLEWSQFENLQHLVEEAMQFAAAMNVAPLGKGLDAAQLAKEFCELQDEWRGEDARRERLERETGQ